MATLSGPGGSHVRLFEAFTGALLWERQLHPPTSGRLLEPPSIGIDSAFWRDVRDIDAYVLTTRTPSPVSKVEAEKPCGHGRPQITGT